MGLSLKTLGQLEIVWNHKPVTGLTLRKSQALLVYLALNPESHDRSHLAGLLWDRLPERNARRNLRHGLHTLRTALDPSVLDCDRVSAGINPDTFCQVDALTFATAVSQADRHRRTGDLDAASRHLKKAVELYRGDFMAGFNVSDCLIFEEWMTGRRMHLRVQLLEALEALVTYWTRRGVHDQALQYARRLLTIEPLSESTHRKVMTLLALTGQRNAALAQYQTCRRILAYELGLEPMEETDALYHAIRSARITGQKEMVPPSSTSSFPSLPFIGREREHADLIKAWEVAQHGQGRLTLVEGEAGVGKTRLLEEVLRFIEANGSSVLRGRCYEFGGSVPYQPIAEALRRCLRERRPTLSSTWMAELARLLPDIQERYADLPELSRTRGGVARQRLFEAVARLLLNLCKTGPELCLFIDDLHWADTSTLDLLHYLIRSLGEAPIWIVGTYRPEETTLSHPLTRLRQGLSRDRRVMRLILTPLSDQSVRRLAQIIVGREAGIALGDYLYRESEGNAFFLVETLGAMREAGTLTATNLASVQELHHRPGWRWSGTHRPEMLPLRIQDVILQRVGRLSTNAQHLLDIAAVIGQQFDVRLLRLASEQDTVCVEKSIAEWLDRRLIESVDAGSPDGYDFSHDKIREVIYRTLAVGRRAHLHCRMGEALEQRFSENLEAHAPFLAYHFERAGCREKASIYLPLAAAQAARVYANERALDYYRRALDLCRFQDERRWRILLQQADVLSLIGSYVDAIQACQDVIDHGQPDWRARAYRSLAQIARIQRNYDAARHYAEESERLFREVNASGSGPVSNQYAPALQALGSIEREQSNFERAQDLFETALRVYQEIGDDRGQADCYRGLGDVLSARGRYRQACRRYEQAVRIFRRLGDKPSVSVCLRGIGVANWRQREYVACRQAIDEGLNVCQTIGDRLGEAASLNLLGLLAIVQGDHAETQRYLKGSVAIYREIGLRRRTAPGLHNLGISEMDCGDMAASRQCLEQALEINTAAGSRSDQALDLGWLGKLHWLLKDYAVAASYLDRALDLDRDLGGGEEEDWHWMWRSAVACESGDLEAARIYLQRAEALRARGNGNVMACDAALQLAHIEFAEGNLGVAEDHARQALAEAQTNHAHPIKLGEALTLLGRIQSHEAFAGEDNAEACFREALTHLQDIAPTVYTRAMTLYHYGRYLDRKGQFKEAQVHLNTASVIFERMGVSPSFTRSVNVSPDAFDK